MKALIFVLLLALSLLASDSSTDLEVKIIERVLGKISIDKEKVIWSDNKEICDAIEKNKLIKTTQNCQEAAIIVLQDKKNLSKKCHHTIVFVLDYALLSQVPKSFGAFFWKKGRPNIVILKPRLKSLFIQASNDLNPYLEDKIW